MKIRPMIFWLIIFGLIGLAFSPSYQEATDEPPIPVIRIDADGVVAEEAVASYCWPIAVGNNRCDFTADLAFENPQSPIEVEIGQSITVIIDNSPLVAGTPLDPSTLTLTALNVESGDSQSFTLQPTLQTIFDNTLPVGLFILQVDAVYNDVSGVQAYVSYRFEVKIYTLATPTPTPSSTPTATNTPRPSPTATITPTPTESGETGDGTPQPDGTGDTTAQPDESGTGTEESGATPVDSSDDATPTPPGGIGPNLPPPTAVEPGTAPTATATLGPTPTSPVAQPNEPPQIQLNFAGRSFQPVGVNFCQVGPTGERVCVDRPLEAQGDMIAMLQGHAAQIQILDGSRPETAEITFLQIDNMAEVQSVDRVGDYLMLFNIDAAPGTYFLRVNIDWGVTTANYFFRIRVS